MPLFSAGDKIEQYNIQTLIKSNSYTETYRVIDADETPYFLKVFNALTVPTKLIDRKTKNIKEISYVSQLNCNGLAKCVAKGHLDNPQCYYYITNFINGPLLQQYVETNGPIEEKKAIVIFKSLLSTLHYLHNTTEKLCHNDIDPSNLMLPESADLQPVLIDLGHLNPASYNKPSFVVSDLNPYYHSNNNASGCFIENDDLFAAVAVLYYMVSGHAPWHQATLDTSLNFIQQLTALKKYRANNALETNNLNISNLLKHFFKDIIGEGVFKEFSSAANVIKWIDKYLLNPSSTQDKKSEQKSPKAKQSELSKEVEFEKFLKRGNGNGFKDVAGMTELKDDLNKKVLFVLKNKDIAKTYKLTPPNGMLLYGPPGCGKTFISEKFAEESGCNYMYIKGSDLGSTYVHGSQLLIGDLFKFAEKNAPIIVCFDEFDSMVPDRSNINNDSRSNEVNEFLSQLNNCAQRGIFVIGSTNRPDKIDTAVLRSGRLDKHIYVPLPDNEARINLFQIHLDGRPLDNNIDYTALAKSTEGYIASDIAYIVNESATVAAFARKKIDQQTLLNTISYTNSSISKETIKFYEDIHKKMDDKADETIRRIGFHRE